MSKSHPRNVAHELAPYIAEGPSAWTGCAHIRPQTRGKPLAGPSRQALQTTTTLSPLPSSTPARTRRTRWWRLPPDQLQPTPPSLHPFPLIAGAVIERTRPPQAGSVPSHAEAARTLGRQTTKPSPKAGGAVTSRRQHFADATMCTLRSAGGHGRGKADEGNRPIAGKAEGSVRHQLPRKAPCSAVRHDNSGRTGTTTMSRPQLVPRAAETALDVAPWHDTHRIRGSGSPPGSPVVCHPEAECPQRRRGGKLRSGFRPALVVVFPGRDLRKKPDHQLVHPV